MWGGIVAVAFAIWFYKAAEQRGLPSMQWAVGGYLSFFVPSLLWSILVSKPLVVELHASHQTLKAGLINASSILVGLGIALLVFWFVLPKKQSRAE